MNNERPQVSSRFWQGVLVALPFAIVFYVVLYFLLRPFFSA